MAAPSALSPALLFTAALPYAHVPAPCPVPLPLVDVASFVGPRCVWVAFFVGWVLVLVRAELVGLALSRDVACRRPAGRISARGRHGGWIGESRGQGMRGVVGDGGVC
jgi:hypothetical protein